MPGDKRSFIGPTVLGATYRPLSKSRILCAHDRSFMDRILTRLFTFCSLFAGSGLLAQPCLVSYTFTSSPLPASGTYGCGESVTFCFTVTNWNSTNANWFHGIGICDLGWMLPPWCLAHHRPHWVGVRGPGPVSQCDRHGHHGSGCSRSRLFLPF